MQCKHLPQGIKITLEAYFLMWFIETNIGGLMNRYIEYLVVYIIHDKNDETLPFSKVQSNTGKKTVVDCM